MVNAEPVSNGSVSRVLYTCIYQACYTKWYYMVLRMVIFMYYPCYRYRYMQNYNYGHIRLYTYNICLARLYIYIYILVYKFCSMLSPIFNAQLSWMYRKNLHEHN